jgi:hypothetical protein
MSEIPSGLDKYYDRVRSVNYLKQNPVSVLIADGILFSFSGYNSAYLDAIVASAGTTSTH